MPRLKRTITTAITVGLLAGALPGAIEAAPRRKPKPKTFTAEGLIAAPGTVTHASWIAQCPEPPTAQGADAYIVEVPDEFTAKPSEAVVEATSVSTDNTVELSFYDYGCGQGELYVPAPTTVPAGTKFIVVQDLGGGAVDFKLTLTQQ